MADTKTAPKPGAAEVTERAESPLAVAFDNMKQAGPAFWLGNAWVESLGELNAEIAHFVAERIEEDVRTQHEILNCRDATKLQEIHARFVRRALEQYSAETGRLVEMSQIFFDRAAKARDA